MAETSQHKALENARKRYDKLIDIMTKDLIKKKAFKQKSEALEVEIRELEKAVEQTNDRASKWREGMEKVIDILAHGRDRFENGGTAEKLDVLLHSVHHQQYWTAN